MDEFILPTPSTSFESKDKSAMEKDLTNKFLRGEMSFAEYSNEWYDFDDDDDIDLRKDEEKKSSQIMEKLPKRRKFARMSTAILGLMGEANLRFVRGETEVAEKMCHEVIKQVPTTPEPYQTLAQIYENDPEKSLQFSLLAAHLAPADSTEWLRLAAISKERNDIKQEMICYTQAIKSDPHNLGLHLKRLEKIDALEEIKYPMSGLIPSRVKCYHKIVTSMPPNEGQTIMKYAKLALTLYHNNNENERALEVMAVAYKKCPNLFNVEDINIFLELLMTCKQYQTCIEVFVASVGVEIEAEIQTVKSYNGDIEELTNYLNCTLPNDLPVDLKSKLLICFIHLGALNLVQSLLNDFLTNDIEMAGDLYMDVEEAFSSTGNHDLALKLLEPLVNNASYDFGAVWLKHAECLRNLGKLEEAIKSYYKVLQLAPQHTDARRKLFALLEQKGNIDEGLEVLEQDRKHVVNASLLYEQCCILKKYDKTLKYLDVGEAVLSKTFMRYRHQDELAIARRTKSSLEQIHNFRSARGEKLHNDDDIHFDEDDSFKLSQEQEWTLFKDLLRIACNHKLYCTMQRIAFGALTSKIVNSYRAQIEYFCLQACILKGDYHNAFRLVRDIVQKHPFPKSWNLLSLATNYTDDNAHIKFLSRLFAKESYGVKNVFLGNNFLISGRYIVALKYFLQYYHEQFGEPLSALLIAITILVMAAQKTIDKHHNLILQGMSYLLKYQTLRKCDQETNYNLGRAYQMLSINNLAIEYYERALSCSPITTCNQHGAITLTRETAFNLYILYKDHSPHMARKYMFKYLVV